MTRGLHRLGASGRLESIAVKPGDPRSLSDAGIMTIVEARNGQLWIGTHDGGANVLDPDTGLIRQLPYGSSTPGAISAASVSAIAEDLNGNFWIGTDGGGLDLAAPGRLGRQGLSPRCEGLGQPARQHRVRDRRSTRRVECGSEPTAAASHWWSDPPQRRIPSDSRWCRASEGLSSDTIWGVLTDATGHLWLSGNAGTDALRPRVPRSQDLPSRARPTGRGIRFRRVFSVARRPACASAARAASTFSTRRACPRIGVRRDWR